MTNSIKFILYVASNLITLNGGGINLIQFSLDLDGYRGINNLFLGHCFQGNTPLHLLSIVKGNNFGNVPCVF